MQRSASDDPVQERNSGYGEATLRADDVARFQTTFVFHDFFLYVSHKGRQFFLFSDMYRTMFHFGVFNANAIKLLRYGRRTPISTSVNDIYSFHRS